MIGDHVYLRLSHAEVADVVDALHGAGVSTPLEQRFATILRSMPTATLGPRKPHRVGGSHT
ncbi:MAG: hypothetical protein JO057_30680 [Chloroflexi bacterium]|nr:hypothetical protein [Chloroflexota bacterium]